MYNPYSDFKIRKTSIWEKFLLLFVKPVYITDVDGNVMTTGKYKHMFGRTYVIYQNICIRRNIR